jgi:opacity protein-like surface antigen|tara:strand:+ start:548 stop:955 length:408 start_codon:yes stop_codon:yes gene_type:complete
MKKLFLTYILAFTTLVASAQFMVVTTVDMPEENESWGMENFTDNLGIGYEVNDKMVIGAVKNGEDYDLWGRYIINNMYISMQSSIDSTDNMRVGVGYSVDLGKKLYLEPNYSMRMKENDEGERSGEFKLGVAYKF